MRTPMPGDLAPGGGAGPGRASGLSTNFHIPDRSGLPSAVLGTGPARSGFPSAVFGTSAVACAGHCAMSAGDTGVRSIAAAPITVLRLAAFIADYGTRKGAMLESVPIGVTT